MIRDLMYSEVAEIARKVQECIEDGGWSLEEALRDVLEQAEGLSVRPDCSFTLCDHGMGLAGGGGCPGTPEKGDCGEFTTKYSEQTEPTKDKQ